MPTLIVFRIRLGWSMAEFARQAGLSVQVIIKAENGEPIATVNAPRSVMVTGGELVKLSKEICS